MSEERTLIRCYGRKSDVRDGVDYVSVIWQREQADAEVARRGKVSVWYEDSRRHNSGRHTRGRRDYLRLLKDIESPDTYAVLVTTQERASRSVRDMANLIEKCQAVGVHLLSPGDAIDTTVSGWSAMVVAQINIRASLAQMESDIASERLKRRVQQYHAKGIPWGKQAYGLVRVGDGLDARVTLGEDAPNVAKVLTVFSGGASLDRTVTRLKEQGVYARTRKGVSVPFDRELVRIVVGNVLAYVGYLCPLGWNAKANRIVLEGEGSWLERHARAVGAIPTGRIQPAITVDLANAVIERRFRTQNVGRKAEGDVPLLTPIVWWKGKKLRAENRDYGRFYAVRGGGPRWDAVELERRVIGVLRDVAIPAPLLQIVRATVATQTSDAERARLGKEIKSLEVQRAKLLDLRLAALVDEDDYAAKYRQIDARLNEIHAGLNATSDVEDRLTAITDLAAALQRMSRIQQRDNIRRLFDRVEIDEAGELSRVVARPWLYAALAEVAQVILANHAKGGNSPQHWPVGLMRILRYCGIVKEPAGHA